VQASHPPRGLTKPLLAAAAFRTHTRGLLPSPPANVLSLNYGTWRGALLQADRCEESVGLVRGAFELSEQNLVLEHEMSEFAKADAALTCLSVFVESVHT
jgi:hypothetical protein